MFVSPTSARSGCGKYHIESLLDLQLRLLSLVIRRECSKCSHISCWLRRLPEGHNYVTFSTIPPVLMQVAAIGSVPCPGVPYWRILHRHSRRRSSGRTRHGVIRSEELLFLRTTLAGACRGSVSVGLR